MATALELKTEHSPSWCPGCGNYGILNGLKSAISRAGLEPHLTVLVSGIGCSGKDPHFVKTYGFEGIHGRVLPVATAIRLANHKLKVIGCAGDGDAYGIGGNHFLHTMRRNMEITYLVHNNQIYGLTTGQASPTSVKGFATKSTPSGVIEEPINPIGLAIAAGATFVARAFVGEFNHLTQVLAQALKHRGFALVDILQPCVTFNYLNTYQWFSQRVYKIDDDPGYDPSDRMKAFDRAQEWGERIPIGVFFRETKPTYEDQLPQIKEKPLAEQDISSVDISKTLAEFI